MNLSLKYEFQSGILKSGLIMLFTADIATMGYLYRAYFGRSIINELDQHTDDKWKYDDNNHKYSLKTENDIKLEEKIDHLKSDYNSIKIDAIRDEIKDYVSKKKNSIDNSTCQQRTAPQQVASNKQQVASTAASGTEIVAGQRNTTQANRVPLLLVQTCPRAPCQSQCPTTLDQGIIQTMP